MTSPFKIRGPGKYKTRDGRIVTVERRRPSDTSSWRALFPWAEYSAAGGVVNSWRDDGSETISGVEYGADLVGRVTDKPRKPKRKAARWEVVVPCKSRKQARIYAGWINALVAMSRRAVVRKGANQ